jgi:hypothetical protein
MLRYLILALLMMTGLSAQASEDPTPLADNQAEEGKVKLKVLVVKASTVSEKGADGKPASPQVDPELEPLLEYFNNYKFNSFVLVDTKPISLADGDNKKFVIVGGRKITVKLLSHDDNKAKMKVLIEGAKGRILLDTTISVNRNGTFIVAGPKFRDGILVLPISASY